MIVIANDYEFRVKHESKDTFVYCGHGGGEAICDAYRIRKFRRLPAALLWGCSSGRLAAHGIHEPSGIALSYLCGGARFVVGNLWDVTDKDLDRLSMHFMDHLLNQSGGGVSIAEALRSARATCKMRFAVGSAPIVYSTPSLAS